jgi:hypothetical protein
VSRPCNNSTLRKWRPPFHGETVAKVPDLAQISVSLPQNSQKAADHEAEVQWSLDCLGWGHFLRTLNRPAEV